MQERLSDALKLLLQVAETYDRVFFYVFLIDLVCLDGTMIDYDHETMKQKAWPSIFTEEQPEVGGLCVLQSITALCIFFAKLRY